MILLTETVRRLIWFLLVIEIPASAEIFKAHLFQEYLSRPVPDWMREQLLFDFKPFMDEGFSITGIEKLYSITCNYCCTYQSSASQTVRLRLIDGKIFLFVRDRPVDFFAMEYCLIFQDLNRVVSLPNVEIVISDWDSVHGPYMRRGFFWLIDEQFGSKRGPAPLLARDKADDFLGSGVVLIPDTQTLLAADILIERMEEVSKASPWETKKPLAVWRGSQSDIKLAGPIQEYSEEFIKRIYVTRPRYKICELAQKYPDLINAGFWAFNADEFNGFKEFVQPMISGWLSYGQHVEYKYLPCLDGWGSTYPGFFWRLATNSVCLKQGSELIQWFYHALKPYVHYIPIRGDISDLLDQIKWARENDSVCKKIAEGARGFLAENLTRDRQAFYLYLVLKQYEQLQRFNLKDYEYETEMDPLWQRIF